MKIGSIDSEEAKMIVRDAIRRGWARMPLKNEETIHGRPITRDEALAGLGDEASWTKESEQTLEEFKRVPEPVPESAERSICRWCGSTRAPVDGNCLRCGRAR